MTHLFKKRLGALGTALMLALALALPAGAAGSEDFEIEDGELVSYYGEGGEVIIPDGVTSIGYGAFWGCEELTSVVIPEGVTLISMYTFMDCVNLERVSFPESLTNIGPGAFDNCPKLKDVTIPAGVTILGLGAFNYGNLNQFQGQEFAIVNGILASYLGQGGQVVIPDGVNVIGAGAFFDCTGLTGVTIPDSVTSIENSAFAGCTGLTTLTLPRSLTTLDISVFFGCDGLSDVYVPNSVTGYDPYRGPFPEEAPNLLLHCVPGSVIETYAKENDIPYVADQEWTAPLAAYASYQNVEVDSRQVEFQMYALVDRNGNPTNYVKVRDVAQILNGTPAQFNVTWNGAVDLVSKTPYTANGTEMNTPFSGDRVYHTATASTKVNGAPTGLEAFVLYDDKGGGYTYYKLRDLGQALGFNVGWTAQRGIFIETDKPYQG